MLGGLMNAGRSLAGMAMRNPKTSLGGMMGLGALQGLSEGNASASDQDLEGLFATIEKNMGRRLTDEEKQELASKMGARENPENVDSFINSVQQGMGRRMKNEEIADLLKRTGMDDNEISSQLERIALRNNGIR